MRDASLYKPCSKVPRRARKGNGNKTNQRDILLEQQFGYGSKLLNGAGGLRSQWVMNKLRIGLFPFPVLHCPMRRRYRLWWSHTTITIIGTITITTTTPISTSNPSRLRKGGYSWR